MKFPLFYDKLHTYFKIELKLFFCFFYYTHKYLIYEIRPTHWQKNLCKNIKVCNLMTIPFYKVVNQVHYFNNVTLVCIYTSGLRLKLPLTWQFSLQFYSSLASKHKTVLCKKKKKKTKQCIEDQFIFIIITGITYEQMSGSKK